MELNDNKDPILMEKLFRKSLRAIFKANWFLNYGESYMAKEQTTIGKSKYPKPAKKNLQATNGMPGNPVNIAGVNKNGQSCPRKSKLWQRII
jgi:hypothetical protein